MEIGRGSYDELREQSSGENISEISNCRAHDWRCEGFLNYYRGSL